MVEVRVSVVQDLLSVLSAEQLVCLYLISRFRRASRKYGLWASGGHLEVPDNLGEVRQRAMV